MVFVLLFVIGRNTQETIVCCSIALIGDSFHSLLCTLLVSIYSFPSNFLFYSPFSDRIFGIGRGPQHETAGECEFDRFILVSFIVVMYELLWWLMKGVTLQTVENN